jgi:predicted nucleic acid-binding protein
MNGKKVLLDSNVLINASNKNALEIIKSESNELFISIITYVEVLGFEFKNKD